MTPAEMLNPAYWTPERVERVRKAAPRAYSMHILNQYGSAQNAALDYDDVIAAFTPLEGAYTQAERFGFADFSDLSGPDGDETVLLVAGYLTPHRLPQPKVIRTASGAEYVERDEYGYEVMLPMRTRTMLRVEAVHSWRGRHPMGDVVAEMAGILKRHGAEALATDQRSDTAVQALFSQHSIRATSYHWTNESKHDAVQALARSLAAREISICESPRLREQMLAYGYKLAPGGRFVYQGRGANDDHVAALLTGHMFLGSPEALMLSAQKAQPLRGSPFRANPGGRQLLPGK